MTPITKATTGLFDPEKALIALRRGAAMNVDLNHGWEYGPVMGEQIEQLRTRYNILPIEAFRARSGREGEKLGDAAVISADAEGKAARLRHRAPF